MNQLLNRLKKKALKSSCRYKVAALGLLRDNEPVIYRFNSPRLSKYHGSMHAEMKVMRSGSAYIKTIILLRVGKSGIIKPIHPCRVCASVANDLGIKIVSIRSA